jgi:hypothetical protein
MDISTSLRTTSYLDPLSASVLRQAEFKEMTTAAAVALCPVMEDMLHSGHLPTISSLAIPTRALTYFCVIVNLGHWS